MTNFLKYCVRAIDEKREENAGEFEVGTYMYFIKTECINSLTNLDKSLVIICLWLQTFYSKIDVRCGWMRLIFRQL